MEYFFSVNIDWKQRVDMYLSALFKDFSRSYIQKIIDKWQLKVNNETLSKNKKIQHKDELKLTIISEKLELEAENLHLDIIFQNKDFAIINKEAWMNTHPVPWDWGKTGTLVNWILHQIKDLWTIWGIERPGIIHRLDKDTSWLIMIAKNDSSMVDLQKIIKSREIEKYYIAIVAQKIESKKFKIESEIWRDPNNRIKMTSKNPINPKYALSFWEVLGYIDNTLTVVKVKIETGRTHQIRVHMASIGHPIVWDKVYWKAKVNKICETKYGLKRQALHAYELKFNYKWQSQNFIAPLKEDMQKIYNLLD